MSSFSGFVEGMSWRALWTLVLRFVKFEFVVSKDAKFGDALRWTRLGDARVGTSALAEFGMVAIGWM
jgi:hypothetical protein